MALDENGKILGLRARALDAVGAYTASAVVAVVVYGLRLAPGPYAVGALHATAQAVFTNTSPLAPYRGAGRPEAAYLAERLIDEAAVVTGIDRIELRRRNLIRPEAMPYATLTGYVYDSGEFEVAMDKCLGLVDWNGFAARKAQSEAAGLLRGRGLAYFIEEAGVFNERMDLRFDSERQRHDPRRHALARPGPRHDVRANGVGVAGRTVREHPLPAGRHAEDRCRPWHLRLAQHHGRRLRPQGRVRRGHRERRAGWLRS